MSQHDEIPLSSSLFFDFVFKDSDLILFDLKLVAHESI